VYKDNTAPIELNNKQKVAKLRWYSGGSRDGSGMPRMSGLEIATTRSVLEYEYSSEIKELALYPDAE